MIGYMQMCRTSRHLRPLCYKFTTTSVYWQELIIPSSSMIIFQRMLVLEMIWTAFCYSYFRVSQAPQHIIQNFGASVTVTCAFNIPPDDSEVDVLWWKLGDNTFLHPTSDARKRYFKRKGQGTLQLLDVRLEDAGVYYCGVSQNRAAISNGTGTRLVVHSPPSTPTILSKMPDGSSDIDLHLVCETVDFYPEGITFNWYKNSSKIATGIKSTEYLTDAGLYRASSTLQESQPVQKDNAYICLVSHSTLQSPKLSVYLESRSNSGPNQDMARQCEETMLEMTEENNMGYAALNLFSSEKRRTHRQQEECTQYAAIKTGMDGSRDLSKKT
ncbi:uncharacterized protein LOC122558695 isoform X2 [Chiloscyllium plagiosum]|uniref:uncharacterized protein LOC122558695 isoform X2 n=1 Tax=Chiloscyllium plagiosum TaxID=36176 RepID=UPI001CB7E110|nr:uncharacterized protein LOC122558695 isoform X2 [Chiloscyllium plagiosum]